MKYVGAAKSIGGAKITNIADGTTSTDAASFGQLETVRKGTNWKQKVRLVATSNIDISAHMEGDSIDGVSTEAGNSVLLTAQTTASQNGIYVVSAGSGMTRRDDMATGSNAAGAVVDVTEGTSYHDTWWICKSNDGSAVVGTNSLVFEQDTSGNTYSPDNVTLELDGNTFSIKAGGVTETEINSSGLGDGLTGGSGTPIAVDVDGSSIEINGSGKVAVKAQGVNADAINNDARGHVEDVGDGTETAIPVTHNLGTRDLIVQLRQTASPYAQVEADVNYTSTNVVTLTFGTAPTSGQYRVLISRVLAQV